MSDPLVKQFSCCLETSPDAALSPSHASCHYKPGGKNEHLPLCFTRAGTHLKGFTTSVLLPQTPKQSVSLVGASLCCISTKGGGSFPPQLGPGKQNWSLDPRSTRRREGEGCAHLQEAAQAVEVAAGAEGGLVEVLQQQDERGVPRGLRAAQLLSDGEELALHLGAVQQQHSPGDTGTEVRRAGRLLVAQRPAESHARWQRPLASAAAGVVQGCQSPAAGRREGRACSVLLLQAPLAPLLLQYCQPNGCSVSPGKAPAQLLVDLSGHPTCVMKEVGAENARGPQNIFPFRVNLGASLLSFKVLQSFKLSEGLQQ